MSTEPWRRYGWGNVALSCINWSVADDGDDEYDKVDDGREDGDDEYDKVDDGRDDGDDEYDKYDKVEDGRDDGDDEYDKVDDGRDDDDDDNNLYDTNMTITMSTTTIFKLY